MVAESGKSRAFRASFMRMAAACRRSAEGLGTHRRGSHPCQSAMARSRSRQNRPLGDCKAGPFDATVRRLQGRPTQDHAMISPLPLLRHAPRRRMFPLAALAALLLVLPIAAGCSKDSSSSSETPPASAADPVVARVNGVDIRQSDLALAEEDLGADMQSVSPEARREHLISYLADIIMVNQAAEKKKLADNPEFKRRLAFLRNKLLMGYELQEEAKAAITDEALQQTYNDAVKSIGGQEEVRARHILVDSEDEAKTLLDQIKGGADFATIAKEKSKDPGAAQGGDLGYFTQHQLAPAFAEVAFKMYPGQLSNPVKTQFGWHIIKVEDKRTKQPPEFEKVKDQIEAYLARKSQSEFIGKLRQSAKIERFDKPAEQGKPPGQSKN